MTGGYIIMMRGQWYKVPSELFNDDGITKGDMAVFAYLADRLKGDCKAISVRSIAAATELSQRQVQRCLAKLTERRYISADHRQGQCTLYRQLLLPIRGHNDEYTMGSNVQTQEQDIHIIAG